MKKICGRGVYDIQSIENNKIYRVHANDMVNFQDKEEFISIFEVDDVEKTMRERMLSRDNKLVISSN